MSKIIQRLRKEAVDRMNGEYIRQASWRAAILEAIFRPKMQVGGGRAPMSHLHPDHDKLHLPPGVYFPDWRKYRIEDHPMLVNFQKRCHESGLHDPWLRNYCSGLYPNKTVDRSRFAFITTGLSWGLSAATIFFIGQKIYGHFYPTVYDHTPEYVAKYGTKELH